MESTERQDASGPVRASQGVFSESDAVFARRLRSLRTAAGLTQQDIADRMQAAGYDNIHRSTVGKIETCDRPVTIGEAVQFARALSIGLSFMLEEPSGRDFGLALAEMAAKRRIIAELTAAKDEADSGLAAARARLQELERDCLPPPPPARKDGQ